MLKGLKPEDYCLDRFDVLLDPTMNARIYAGRKELVSALKRRMDRAYRTGAAMHTLLYGSFGGGKTHTLYYLVDYMKESGYQARVFHVTCPAFTRNSVVELYQAIIMSFGQKFVYEIVGGIWTIVQAQFTSVGAKTDADRVEIINEFVDHRDLSAVILSYQKPSAEMPYLVWKWLSGEKCSAKERQFLGVITDNSEPMNAIHTLLSLIAAHSKIKRQMNDKTLLVLVIDELEQLKELGEAMDFIDLFRRMGEVEKLVVLLLAYTASAAEEVPVLNNAAVRQRLGFPDSYINVPNFDQPKAKEFIAELFGLLRPKDVNVADMVTKAKKVTTESVSNQFYPFSEEAIDALITKISGSGEPLCPRTIEQALTNAIGDALVEAKTPAVITSDIVTS